MGATINWKRGKKLPAGKKAGGSVSRRYVLTVYLLDTKGLRKGGRSSGLNEEFNF